MGSLLNFDLNEKTEDTQILTDIFFPAFFSKSSNLNHECGKGYNHFHNILRLFDVLLNFPFTTRESMGHYYL